MTTGPTDLNVTELDFDTLKESLRDYLRQQSEFQDYDFEGSGLSVLLDLLAYNTHYHAFYTNMLVNESFIDSAVKRTNVVSHAKELGYIPRSVTAPRAIVDITISTTDQIDSITIETGTVFTTQIDNQTYRFVTNRAYKATPDEQGNYVARDVELVEGRLVIFSYTVNTQNPDQRYLIRSENADTSTLDVRVQQSPSVTDNVVFQPIDDLTTVQSNDPVYIVQEVEEMQHEVKFGDGIVGRAVQDGNVILLDYIVTNGTEANKAANFALQGAIQGYQNVTVDTNVEARGGADRESIESIRLNAPLFYQSQNRAVTIQDYKTQIAKNATIIQNADSVAVWGGEDNQPPRYGSVFISLKPKIGNTISSALKDVILDQIIDDLNVVTVTPEIVDPEFLQLELDIDFEYNSNQTSRSQSQLEQLVAQTVQDFNDQTLEFFNQTFRYSTFLSLIDNAERSVQNNLTSVRIKKQFTPRINDTTMYQIRFENPVTPGTLQSSQFVVNEPTQTTGDVYFFEDDEQGNLVLIKQLEDFTRTTIDDQFGSVDYDNGNVTIDQFTPQQLIDSTQVSLSFKPQENDVFPVRNLILSINSTDVTVRGNAII